jgi:hypothetical protein
MGFHARVRWLREAITLFNKKVKSSLILRCATLLTTWGSQVIQVLSVLEGSYM